MFQRLGRKMIRGSFSGNASEKNECDSAFCREMGA